MLDVMDTNNNSSLEKQNNIFGTHPIFAKPFLGSSKIEVFTGQNF